PDRDYRRRRGCARRQQHRRRWRARYAAGLAAYAGPPRGTAGRPASAHRAARASDGRSETCRRKLTEPGGGSAMTLALRRKQLYAAACGMALLFLLLLVASFDGMLSATAPQQATLLSLRMYEAPPT